MPHYVDFSKFKDIKTLEVHPDGWVTPLYIEYDISMRGDTSFYFWRVKGTSHTFIIPVIRMSFLSSGDFKSHFEEALENFRKDYLQWKEENFATDWMKEYKQEYEKFILT